MLRQKSWLKSLDRQIPILHYFFSIEIFSIYYVKENFGEKNLTVSNRSDRQLLLQKISEKNYKAVANVNIKVSDFLGATSKVDISQMTFISLGQESTGVSPFYLFYGREAVLPVDVALGNNTENEQWR